MSGWYERRDVLSGRIVGSDYGGVKQARVSRPAWFIVTAGSCANCSACEGFEVCLHRCELGGSRSPLWPVISAPNQADARAAMRALTRFARTLNLDDRPFDQEINGDPRIAAWLTEQGYTRRNHICWSRPKLGDAA